MGVETAAESDRHVELPFGILNKSCIHEGDRRVSHPTSIPEPDRWTSVPTLRILELRRDRRSALPTDVLSRQTPEGQPDADNFNRGPPPSRETGVLRVN